MAIPGTIQVENFDYGGAEVAYHDLDVENHGGSYRTPETSVDIDPITDMSAGHAVTWFGVDEWLEYTVNVQTTGSYTLSARVAMVCAGSTTHLELDGTDVSGPILVPVTGGWGTWQTVTLNGIPLLAGSSRVLRLVADTAPDGNCGLSVGNWNWISLQLANHSTPFDTTPVKLPATIQTEKFDNGGEGVAYHDDTVGNNGGATYREGNVDISTTATEGLAVTWFGVGEWLNYTMYVPTSRSYTLTARVAMVCPNAQVHFEVNTANVTGQITVPVTGGWDSYETFSRTITLTAGRHVIKLKADAAPSPGCGTSVGNWNWFRIE
jgi:hypothetical protein